jgi:hypothetical protein
MEEDKKGHVTMDDKNTTTLGITLNVLYASVGVVSAILYGKQAYSGIKFKLGK